MSEFAGFVNLERNLQNEKYILEEMNLELKQNSEKNLFLDSNIGFTLDKLRKNNIEIKFENSIYKIIFNGNIYNKNELENDLKENGLTIEDDSDEEIIVKGFIKYGVNFLKRINGVFSLIIWDEKDKKLYLARDKFGIKPLYYTFYNNTIIFSTQVKALLKYPGVEAILDENSIGELIGVRTSTYSRRNSFKKYK